MITISKLIQQIQNTGLSPEITSDHRGSHPGGPVRIQVSKNNHPFTDLSLKTMTPPGTKRTEIESYYISHITIDEALTFRVPKVLTVQEVWNRIYNTLMEATSVAYREQRSREHFRRRLFKPRFSRYLQRPSRHYQQTTSKTDQ